MSNIDVYGITSNSARKREVFCTHIQRLLKSNIVTIEVTYLNSRINIRESNLFAQKTAQLKQKYATQSKYKCVCALQHLLQKAAFFRMFIFSRMNCECMTG